MRDNKKDNWIPCTPNDIKTGTGRLPSVDDCKCRDYSSNEKFGSFIVTTISGYEFRDRGVSQACFRIGENKSFWYRDGTDMREKDNIIAWQPLPEKYKGELKDFKIE